MNRGKLPVLLRGGICGIDPGVSGGIAFISDSTGDVLAFSRIPCRGGTGTGEPRWLDSALIVPMIKEWAPSLAVIEKPLILSKNSGVSNLSIGRNYGILIACLQYARVRRIVEVMPATWKKAMGLSRLKPRSISAANALLKHHAPLTRKEDGVAEAILLARYGYEHIGDLNGHHI